MSGIIDTVGSKSGVVGSDVYPAGHIITFKSLDTTPTSANTYVGGAGWTPATIYTITINKKLGSTSKIVLMCSYNWNGYYSSGYACISKTKWLRSAPTAWSSAEFNQYRASENNGNAYENHYIQQSNGFTDSSTATGNHTYTMQINTTAGTGNIPAWPGHVQAMEVKI